MYHLISSYAGLPEPYQRYNIKLSFKAMTINHFLFSDYFDMKHVRQVFSGLGSVYVSARHVIIALTRFVLIPNSNRILYIISP
jgi:hypothetical protein